MIYECGDKLRKFFHENILFLFFFIWMFFWGRYNWADLCTKSPYYKIALRSSWEEIREMSCFYDSESLDYYRVLKFCDKVIPAGEKLRVILPQNSPQKHNFLMGKARYYLYPRYYGNINEPANYVLFYAAGDSPILGNYEKCVEFGKDKYLLAAKGCQSLRIEE